MRCGPGLSPGPSAADRGHDWGSASGCELSPGHDARASRAPAVDRPAFSGTDRTEVPGPIPNNVSRSGIRLYTALPADIASRPPRATNEDRPGSHPRRPPVPQEAPLQSGVATLSARPVTTAGATCSRRRVVLGAPEGDIDDETIIRARSAVMDACQCYLASLGARYGITLDSGSPSTHSGHSVLEIARRFELTPNPRPPATARARLPPPPPGPAPLGDRPQPSRAPAGATACAASAVRGVAR
jgi:hypothetical protein